jgi:Flp pilus assembly protein TadG
MASQSVISRFVRNERGSTMILFGLTISVAVGFVGIAVDGARWHSARRMTSQAIDSAVLVGARHMQVNPGDTANAILAAQTYYTTNTRKRAPIVSDTVTFALSDNDSAITSQGHATMRTSFLNVVGIKELELVTPASTKQAKASFRTGLAGSSNIELSLMLDLTGSMCNDGNGPCASGTKIDGLRTAASDLINIVVQDIQSPYTSRIAIVPFSTRIRVEPDNGDGSMMKKLTNLDPTWTGWNLDCPNATGGGGGEANGNWSCPVYVPVHKTNWKILPCVTERAYDSGGGWINSNVDYTDDAPGPGKWLNAHGGDRSPDFVDSSNTPNTGDNGQTSAKATSQWNYDSSSSCSEAPEENAIIPLTSDKTLLQNKIAQFSAVGATSGAASTAWSWYMLSPKWNSVWTGTSQPGPYSDVTATQSNGAPVLRKVAVLMTDGAFNAFRSSKEQDAAIISNHAKQLCAKMKEQHIEIFTVGFALDALTGTQRPIAEDMLKSCGTDLSHFYSSLTVPELQAAFRDIAVKVTPIRLTQ